MKINKKKIIKGAGWLYFDFFLTGLINFGIAVLIVKYLSVDSYGQYGVYISLFSIIAIISYLGLPNIIQRFFPDYFISPKNKIAVLFNSALFIRIITQVMLVFFLYILILNKLVPKINTINFCLIFTFGLFVVGRADLVNSEEALNAIGEQKRLFVYRFVSNILKVFIFLYFVLNASIKLSVIFFAIGLSELVFTFLTVVYINKKFGSGIKDFRISFKVFNKEELSYAKYNYLSQIQTVFSNGSLDTLIVAMFLSETALAYFVFATIFSGNLIKFLPIDPLYRSMLPDIIRNYSETNSPELLSKSLRLFNKIILIVYLPIIVFLILNIEAVVVFFGKFDYLGAKFLLIGFLIIKFISLFATPLKLGLVVLKQARELFYSNLFFFLVPAVLIISIRVVGVSGTLISGFSAVLGMILFRSFFLHKLIDFNLYDNGFFKVFFVLLIIAFPFFLVPLFHFSKISSFILSVLFLSVNVFVLHSLKLIPNEVFVVFSEFTKKKIKNDDGCVFFY